ncbi:hypothetical protein WJX72_011164 [[Myrmecia] bisecta]|uniref:Uncharacterized protein n=1 Tax=[Myrmecia] bisecta TaxID=41462 RepID=A0AAW1QTX0_9CHLO
MDFPALTHQAHDVVLVGLEIALDTQLKHGGWGQDERASSHPYYGVDLAKEVKSVKGAYHTSDFDLLILSPPKEAPAGAVPWPPNFLTTFPIIPSHVLHAHDFVFGDRGHQNKAQKLHIYPYGPSGATGDKTRSSTAWSWAVDLADAKWQREDGALERELRACAGQGGRPALLRQCMHNTEARCIVKNELCWVIGRKDYIFPPWAKQT